MKILHIGMHFNPLRGGGNLRNSEIIRHSVEEYNDDIYIISKIDEGYEQKLPAYLKANEDYRNVHCYFHNSSFDQAREAMRLSRKIKFDVIHFHNQRVAFMVGFYFRNYKTVLELHAILNLDKWKDWLFRRVVDNIKHFIVLGEQGKTMLLEMYSNIEESQVTVVRNGINTVHTLQSTKQVLDPSYFWIGYIGTFFGWQGVYNFVASYKLFSTQYPDLPVRFIMVGGGPEFKNVEDIVNGFDERTRGRITLTGTISPTEIANYWKQIDVAVLPRPSTNETESTEPLKLQEAINYEKVIVATDVGGFRSLLKPGYNALLSTPGNNQGLADNYYRVYADPALRQTLIENSRETKQQLVTWTETVRNIHAIYVRLAGSVAQPQ